MKKLSTIIHCCVVIYTLVGLSHGMENEYEMKSISVDHETESFARQSLDEKSGLLDHTTDQTRQLNHTNKQDLVCCFKKKAVYGAVTTYSLVNPILAGCSHLSPNVAVTANISNMATFLAFGWLTYISPNMNFAKKLTLITIISGLALTNATRYADQVEFSHHYNHTASGINSTWIANVFCNTIVAFLALHLTWNYDNHHSEK